MLAAHNLGPPKEALVLEFALGFTKMQELAVGDFLEIGFFVGDFLEIEFVVVDFLEIDFTIGDFWE